MYLQRLETGHRFPARQILRVTSTLVPRAPLDVVRVLMYRPEYFGAPFCRVGQLLMRGPSERIGWTVGERELVAAFTSRMNGCVF
jgi:hypothetical protein